MIVVDASALAKLLLREEGWRLVHRSLSREQAVTVDHALKEVLNAVWKAARLRGLIPRRLALEKEALLHTMVEKGVLRVEDERHYLRDAFRIALDTGLTVYDSLYIAQAKTHQAPLLTSDTRQAEAAASLGVKPMLIP